MHSTFRFIITLVILLLLAGLNLACAQPSMKTLLPKQMEESLYFVEQTVSSAHVGSTDGFTPRVEAALKQACEAIKEPQSAESFYFILNRFLQNLEDAHTVVRIKESAAGSYLYLDLPVFWNESGLFFTRASHGFEAGDRIVSFGSLSESALLERLAEVIPTENIAYLKAKAASLLNRSDYLRMLNVLDANQQVSIEVISVQGEQRQASLLLAPAKVSLPQELEVSYEIMPEQSLGVFRFSRFEYSAEMVNQMEHFFQEVEQQNIGKIAVDLRNNPGGDSSVAIAFLEHFSGIEYRAFSVKVRVSDELNERMPQFAIAAMNPVLGQFGEAYIEADAKQYTLPQALVKASLLGRLTLVQPGQMIRVSDRHLYVLTDALTFSSGNLFTILVKDNRLGQIVGEPTGNRVNFNGSELRFDIPHTPFYLNLSTAQMIRPEPGLGDADSIVPDVWIGVTPESASNGVDPIIEYLKSQ